MGVVTAWVKQDPVRTDIDIPENIAESFQPYSNVSTTSAKKRVVSCLVYPCQNSTWESLASRGRLFHKASLASGDRQIDLILIAVPMHGKTDETALALVSAF